MGTRRPQKSYEPILRLEKIMDQTSVIPYPKANTFLEPKTPYGKRYMFSGANFLCPLDTDLFQQASEMFRTLLSKPGNDEMKARSMVGLNSRHATRSNLSQRVKRPSWVAKERPTMLSLSCPGTTKSAMKRHEGCCSPYQVFSKRMVGRATNRAILAGPTIII